MNLAPQIPPDAPRLEPGNLAPPLPPDARKLEPGQRIVLDASELGYVVEAGRAELFLLEVRDGAPVSRRHFLFEVKPGSIVMPLLAHPDGICVLLIAIEATVLTPAPVAKLTSLAQTADQRQKLAPQVDHWVISLSAAVGVSIGMPPGEAQAVNPGEEVACAEGAVVTVRSGAAWIAKPELALSYCDGTAVDSGPGLAIAPGTWVSTTVAGTLKTATTAQVLETAAWMQALRQFHMLALGAIQKQAAEQFGKAEKHAADRKDTSERLAERVIGSFHDVAKTERVSWRGRAREDERVLATFMIVAEASGLDLPQRAREQIRKAKTVDEAIRAARLRQRVVALRGDWWREDLGPLIGFLDEERRVVALLPSPNGRWELIDPVDGTTARVNGALAERLAPTAHMLYPVFPDKPLGFKEFIKFGLERHRRDLAIAVLTAIAGAALSLATPMAMRLAFDRFIPAHQGVQLVELAIGLFLAAVISTLFRIAYDHAALRMEGRAAGNYPAGVMDRILRLPEAALRFGSADLALRFASTDSLRRSVSTIVLTSIPAIFLCICNGFLMFYYAPAAAGVALGSFVLLCLLSAVFAWQQRDAQRKGEQLNSDIFNIVFQLVQAVTVLRTAGAETRAFAHWGVDFAELRKRSHKARKISTVFETLLITIEVASLAGMFFLLALLPADRFSTGAFIAFVWAYGAFYASSIQLVRNVGTAISLDSSWERAAPLLKAVPEQSVLKRDPGRLSGAIDVTNVAFRYPGGEGPWALGGVSMQVAAGEFVAVVGASGSGKSTMMRLLLGLDQPMQGTIQYDGHDLRHLDPELVRRQMGVVLQNGKLFPGSLFENIMGSHNGTVEEAWEAIKQAGIEEEIRALPMGIHTVVTEASAAFSGGQVQRLIIARALVGKPRILLFDEATSALDNITQSIVTQSLSRLAVTRVVIAHRLTTVKQADRIYVFDKGKVAQSGTYDELVKAKGPFAEFARRQLV
jgi:NHLM bacteriocin system ABC transporter ATP-binding protein